MATIADLVVKISASTAGAEKDMRSFGSKAQGIFGKALLPAVGILGGVAIAAKKTTNAASDLTESQNAVNVVFGKSAGKIGAFAKVADKEAGLSMRALNQLVTPLGASFVNLGDSTDVAATKSINLAKRAADMASVFNTTVPDAMQAIQAAMRGEADPIERFGVNMKESAVSAHALSMGLAKTRGELTESDKAQARYALLMEQSSKFQGDFVRTSGEAANAARINAAAQENLSATLGSGLLPVVKTYQRIIASVTGFMAQHTGAVQIGAGVLAALAAAVILVNAGFLLYSTGVKAATLVTKAWTAATTLLNIVMRANPILLVTTLIIALAAAIVLAYRRSETFRNIVTGAWNAIKAVTMSVFNFVRSHIGSVMGAIKLLVAVSPVALLITHFNSARDKVRAAMNAMRSVVSSVVGAIKSAVGSIAGAFEGVISTVWRLISAIRSIPSPKLPSRGGGVPFVPGVATGGAITRGGWAMVGERGPELVRLPTGSTVFSNSETRGALRGGVGGGRDAPLIGEVHVHNEADEERLARRVVRLLAFEN